MELDEAIGSISDIRAQITRTELFRGCRSLTAALSGLFGLVAAVIQARNLPAPSDRLTDYLYLWISVAVLNLLLVGTDIAHRWFTTDSPLKRRLTVQVIQQFSPCLVAGAAVTAVVARSAQDIAWTLPGLWAIFFGLGILACGRLLPRPMFWVGAYYLVMGTLCLAVGEGSHKLDPWQMAGTFGIGQLLAAGVLAYILEKGHE